MITKETAIKILKFYANNDCPTFKTRDLLNVMEYVEHTEYKNNKCKYAIEEVMNKEHRYFCLNINCVCNCPLVERR